MKPSAYDEIWEAIRNYTSRWEKKESRSLEEELFNDTYNIGFSDVYLAKVQPGPFSICIALYYGGCSEPLYFALDNKTSCKVDEVIDPENIEIIDYINVSDPNMPIGAITKRANKNLSHDNTRFTRSYNSEGLKYGIYQNNEEYEVKESWNLHEFPGHIKYKYFDIDLNSPIILFGQNEDLGLTSVSLIYDERNILAYKYFGWAQAKILKLKSVKTYNLFPSYYNVDLPCNKFGYVIDYDNEIKNEAVDMLIRAHSHLDNFKGAIKECDWKIIGFEDYKPDANAIRAEVKPGPKGLYIYIYNKNGGIIDMYEIMMYSNLAHGETPTFDDIELVKYKSTHGDYEIIRARSLKLDYEIANFTKEDIEYKDNFDEMEWNESQCPNPNARHGDEELRDAFEDDPDAMWGVLD